MCVLRPDGSFELVNATLGRLIGDETEDGSLGPDRERSSPTFIDAVHPDDRAATESAFGEAAANGGTSVRFVNRFRGKTDRYHIVEWRGRSHPESGLLYVLGTDVTETQKTADALRASRENLHALVQVAAQGILTVGRSGTILSANPMAERIFGYGPGALVGAKVESLLPESARDAHREHRAQYSEAPQPRAMGQGLDLKGRRKDGSQVPLEISLSHFESDEGLVAVALVSDITERRKAEVETRQLERRLEHATKMEAIGRLAGGIAHDFNNLLTALSGFAEIVLDELPADHPLCEGAHEVKLTCQRSVSMVRRLLATSRQQVLAPTRLDVGAKVSELSRMLRGVIGDDIELAVTVDPSAPPARLDEGQLEQVVLNLVVNAKDALSAHGRIEIAVEPHQDGAGRRRGVTLRVSDNGRGMSARVLAQIFAPFFTTRSQGTGLGLAMVKSIVERASGRIDVTSTEGEGTTFEVFFPEYRDDAAAKARPPEADPEPKGHDVSTSHRGGSETVLVAETENSVRHVAAESLRRAGYHVLEARDGEEALRVGDEHGGPLDLVVTDVIMPRASGPELVSRLRERRPNLRALFMSGYPPEELAQHGIDNLGELFLPKPFSRELLTTVVRRALDDGRPES